MKQNKHVNHITHLRHLLRAATAASALALALGTAWAQGPVQGVPGTPRVDQPRQGGGGGGIGINIDLGSVFNAIKNATKKDEQPKDDQTKPPVLQKKATTVSSGASGNYTIDWVVQYANNTGSTIPKVTVTDGPISTIIPGSLQPPPNGWAATTNALPLPADNFALWTGTNIAPHGLMTATFPPAGPAVINVGAGGDGFQPIPYVHPSGRRIYVINHHTSPAASSTPFDCVDISIGSRCATSSGSWPRMLPFGDGTTAPSGTTSNNAEYVINGGKIYYPVQNLARWGIGCYDLNTDTQCGFTQLDSSNDPSKQTMLQGPWQVGNELYLADYKGQVYCARLVAGLPACLGSGYKIPLADIKLNVPGGVNTNWYVGLIAGKVINNRLYLTSRTSWVANGGSPKTINCIDATTKQACWNTTNPTRGSGATIDDRYAINYSNFVYYDSTGNPLALCNKSELTPYQACASLVNGAAVTLPRIFPNHSRRHTLDIHVWPRTFFTSVGIDPEGSGAGWCWDWSTGNYCNGVSGAFTQSNNLSGDYGNNMDDRGCIWTYGHDNHLWSYDPNNIDPVTQKAKACGGAPGKATQTFQPLQYCSGPKPFRWTSVEVKGAPLAKYDKFIVKVLDSSNNSVLFTKDIKAANQPLTSVTSIDAQTISKPLKIEVEYMAKPGMGASDKPYLEVRFNAPPVEFCFKSKHTCEQTKITNIVETPDPVKQGAFITVKVDVNKPQDCKEPPPPNCGTATTPACCGQPGQPVCQEALCGQSGQPKCPDTPCIPGTRGCPIIIDTPCLAGDPLCNPFRPPPSDRGCALLGTCGVDKPKQSVAEEFKEPKVACVRKTKPSEGPKKAAAPKPRPKPAVAAAPPAPLDPNAPSKPKPKPRPKAAVKSAAANDDCE